MGIITERDGGKTAKCLNERKKRRWEGWKINGREPVKCNAKQASGADVLMALYRPFVLTHKHTDIHNREINVRTHL